ncbi:MAG TPA: amino acid ABC transporter substrate-binding protein [Candidatus Binatia bacterium]|nr:amino acid ABC transporter substrate-binding protein [Candidatus Binatia bacterium]
MKSGRNERSTVQSRRSPARQSKNLLWFGACALFLFYPVRIDAGETLTRVKSRKVVRCGVSEGLLGFSQKDKTGRWVGLDADFCRAVAAAAVGDPDRVSLVPLSPSARFVALRSNEIDLLLRHTTWTLGREVGLGVHFTGVLFHDSQGFIVKQSSRARRLPDLRGASICVEDQTTSESNLVEYFSSRNWKYQIVERKTLAEVTGAFFGGHCQAYTSDKAQLVSVRLQAPGGPQAYFILPEQISREPVGPAVRRGDEEWFTLIKWVLFALIEAEEIGVTRKNVRSKAEARNDPELERFLDVHGTLAKPLGIEPGWVVRLLAAVGNYGEIFERNLGSESPLRLERGLNHLWTKGGLMYAPPFR